MVCISPYIYFMPNFCFSWLIKRVCEVEDAIGYIHNNLYHPIVLEHLSYLKNLHDKTCICFLPDLTFLSYIFLNLITNLHIFWSKIQTFFLLVFKIVIIFSSTSHLHSFENYLGLMDIVSVQFWFLYQ